MANDSAHRTDRVQVPRNVARRFWSKVDQSDGCWTWTAATFAERGGYGKFQAGTSRASSRVMYAHRFSWELASGRALTSEEHVLHRCDNPLCVRPSHLTVGTPEDNMLDMASKGRGRRGAYSVHPGVSWDRSRGKWQALVGRRSNRKHLGRFDTEADAAEAVRRFKERQCG